MRTLCRTLWPGLAERQTKTTMTTMMMIVGAQKWSNMLIKWNKWESKRGRRQRHFVKQYNLYTFSVRKTFALVLKLMLCLWMKHIHTYGPLSIYTAVGCVHGRIRVPRTPHTHHTSHNHPHCVRMSRALLWKQSKSIERTSILHRTARHRMWCIVIGIYFMCYYELMPLLIHIYIPIFILLFFSLSLCVFHSFISLFFWFLFVLCFLVAFTVRNAHKYITVV